MHAYYLSLLVLVASAAVPALSAPLSSRNIVAAREGANVVARDEVPGTGSTIPLNLNTTNTTNTSLTNDTSPELASNSTNPDDTTPNELRLLQTILSGRSVDETTSLNERDSDPTPSSSPGNLTLADLVMLSALNSRSIDGRMSQALSALGRRDVDNSSGHEEELHARSLFHFIENLMNMVNLRDVVPGELAARDTSTNGAQPLTPAQLLGLALLSSPPTE